MGRTTLTATVLLIATLLSGCGGGGAAPAFEPAKAPPADVCSLLTIDDVHTLLPGARVGVEQQTQDLSHLDMWTRECKWDVSDMSAQAVHLYIFGAMTQGGLAALKGMGNNLAMINTPLTGLGAEAHYWQQDADNGVWALEGSSSANVTAYSLTPLTTEAQFRPLVAKVLGELE